MQTKQSEEPRALSLQEMEETNGGGCGLNLSLAGASIIAEAAGAALFGATLLTPIGAAIGIAALIAAAVDCES